MLNSYGGVIGNNVMSLAIYDVTNTDIKQGRIIV